MLIAMIQKARQWLSGLAQKKADALKARELESYRHSSRLLKSSGGFSSGQLINRGMTLGSKAERAERLAKILRPKGKK